MDFTGFDQQTLAIAIAGLAALSVGGLLFAVFYSSVAGKDRKTERMQRVAERKLETNTSARRSGNELIQRRRSVEQKLKQTEQENQQKRKAAAKGRTIVPLTVQLSRAGMTMSRRGFYIMSAIVGLVAAALSLFAEAPTFVTPALFLVGALGLPRWWLTLRIRRRQKKFLANFPVAVDVIVRGIKSGLPLVDCMRIIANEAQEPVKSEFAHILEKQQLGVTLGDAVGELYKRIPLPEANFFCITISIQQQAGGNLSETLSNLSKVLRERKKMKGKIVAMSTEAKAGAMIIGSLPFAVLLLIYIMSPDYITILFTEQMGHIMLGGCALWMTIGVLVMRKMINFDF